MAQNRVDASVNFTAITAELEGFTGSDIKEVRTYNRNLYSRMESILYRRTTLLVGVPISTHEVYVCIYFYLQNQ